MKMREKEAEMRSYFEIPRPPEIDFSDFPRDQRLKSRGSSVSTTAPVVEVINLDVGSSSIASSHTPTLPPPSAASLGSGDDSPFRGGDDIERLIAERIAARQRDMEEITEQMKASMPPSQQQQQPLPLKEYDPNEFMPAQMASPPTPLPSSLHSEETRKVRFQEDTNPIFLKLKRKPMINDE
jgi:hypothetical protein